MVKSVNELFWEGVCSRETMHEMPKRIETELKLAIGMLHGFEFPFNGPANGI